MPRDMTHATTSPAEPSARKPLLRRVDAAVFRAESSLLSLALIATTVMVFVDVVYRRLVAPDSKVGGLLASVAGITDPVKRAALDANVAPWVAVLLTFGVVLVGAGHHAQHQGGIGYGSRDRTRAVERRGEGN